MGGGNKGGNAKEKERRNERGGTQVWKGEGGKWDDLRETGKGEIEEVGMGGAGQWRRRREEATLQTITTTLKSLVSPLA
jgi:hypothetical protein